MYKTFPARSLTLAVTLTDLEISTLKLQNQEMTVAFLIGEAVRAVGSLYCGFLTDGFYSPKSG